jgi:hypothetical protein
MTSFAHTKILKEIAQLDAIPADNAAYKEWTKAEQHLAFINSNGGSDEVVLFASGPFTYIHSLIVANSRLKPLNKNDLLNWSSNPDSSFASYVSGGGREGIWIEREDPGSHGSECLAGAFQIVFRRNFEGWAGADRSYFEINQEFTHLSDIHLRSEHRAYCKYDQLGDLQKVVSISNKADCAPEIQLVSVRWAALENYLAIADASLVRFFDLTLFRAGSFDGWGPAPEAIFDSSDRLFYRQKIAASAAYTRGVEILPTRQAPVEIIRDMNSSWLGECEKTYVEFTAFDWRHSQVSKISTDPAATTNYFAAKENDLPFELSPAFFKPEVLSKYKTDKDKYTVCDRNVSCRAAWYLKGYDVNDAGQIHVYLCDLRRLPYTEQLHWLSFNEPPLAGISERSYANDFLGEWVEVAHPLRQVISILLNWQGKKAPLWAVRDEKLFERVSTPLTTSTDEWAEAFMDLSKLIIEGFETKKLRQALDAEGISHSDKEQSVLLLEKLLGISNSQGGNGLAALRTVQRIRSKVMGHSGSSEAQQIIDQAITSHGNYTKHFEEVCRGAVEELKAIEKKMWP